VLLDADAFVSAMQEEAATAAMQAEAAAAAAADLAADVCSTEAARHTPQYGWAVKGMRAIEGLQDESSIYVAQLMMARLLQAGRVLTFLGSQLPPEHTEKARVVAAELEQEWSELRQDWAAVERAKAEGAKVRWPGFERQPGRHTPELPVEPARPTRMSRGSLPPKVCACALCIVHCALCIVHCALCIVHCALCIVHVHVHAHAHVHTPAYPCTLGPSTACCHRPRRRCCSPCTPNGA
jgi:hypothetical protein